MPSTNFITNKLSLLGQHYKFTSYW